MSVMSDFPNPNLQRRAGSLWLEDVALADLAGQYGSPLYVYSRAALEAAYRSYDAAFASHPHRICYAVKANSSLAILQLFASLGSGFDIVSGGELQRVLRAGGEPGKVVFSGVGKTVAEMELALNAGIGCFNVESAAELERLNQVAARLGRRAPVSLRVNPNVDAKTHPYISTGLKENKFGVAFEDALPLYRRARELGNLDVHGIDCHIGSQLTEVSPFGAALDKVLELLDALEAEGFDIRHLDLGGGVGIRYRDETPPDVAVYAETLLSRLQGRKQTVFVEPGRSLVGNAGLLLTSVEYLKNNGDKHFAIIDAAMNDLMRPALYEAWHEIVPVQERAGTAAVYDIVGPVCETGDFLGHARPLVLQQGDVLAVLSAGAYGMSMSSNYNTRGRAAEVMVSGSSVQLIRERETVDVMLAQERLLK